MIYTFDVEKIEDISDGKEVWKELFGYEGLYEISNLGNIRSLDREVWNGTNFHTKKGKDLKTFKKSDGYVIVQLTKDGISKTVSVHRLVALTFLEREEGRDFVDHINTIRDDNRVDNLRWTTRSENINNEITKEKVHEAFKGSKNPNSKKVVCLNTRIVFDYIRDAAKEYNIKSHSNITSCCKGKLKTVGIDKVTGEKLVWVYLSDYENMSEDDILKRLEESKPKYASSTVMCKNTGEVFNSVKEAAEKYSINESSIRQVCNGKSKSTSNGLNKEERLCWKYIKKRG